MSKIEIDIELLTRQANRNAKALEGSTLGLAASLTSVLAAVELAKRAFSVLAAAFSSTVGKAVELESALAEVSTLYDSTADSQKKLTEEVLELQRTFGAGSVETSKAYYQALSSGAVTAADAQDLLIAANKLSVGGVTEVSTAVDGLTNIMNAYDLSAEEATTISDSLFIAMKNGKTTVEELSNSIGQVAPSAAQLGVSFNEVLASTSAITTTGIKTSVAMTQLKAVFANLSKPTEALSAALKRAGITSVEASLAADGLVGTLEKIQGTTGGAVTELQALFGSVEAGQAVVTLTSDVVGNKFNQTLSDMDAAASSAGTVTEEAFEKIANSSAQKLKVAQGNISALATELGATLSPAFNGLLEV